jgi:dienelactone hydrolase
MKATLLLTALLIHASPTALADKPDPGPVLAPFLQAPAEWVGRLGDYRSPLIRENGDRVQQAAEWPGRRAEIESAWTRIMGAWPPILESPRYEVLRQEPEDKLIKQRIRFEAAPDQFQEGWLLRPEGDGPHPAVLVVYYEPETSVGMNPKQTLRDFGLQLARRGFVTLSIGSPGGNAWKPELGGARCQPLSYHAYVAANCWQLLAAMPQVDSQRIGVVGHSYGGKWALFAAALWPQFAAVAVSDPGIVFDETRGNVNYWEPWYLGEDGSGTARRPGIPSPENPATGAYAQLRKQNRDLHEIHALLAPRPFLVSGGAEDPPERWTALNHLIQINQLLGADKRVAMTNRPKHDPDEASNAVIYAFFEHFLQRPAQP